MYLSLLNEFLVHGCRNLLLMSKALTKVANLYLFCMVSYYVLKANSHVHKIKQSELLNIQE